MSKHRIVLCRAFIADAQDAERLRQKLNVSHHEYGSCEGTVMQMCCAGHSAQMHRSLNRPTSTSIFRDVVVISVQTQTPNCSVAE